MVSYNGLNAGSYRHKDAHQIALNNISGDVIKEGNREWNECKAPTHLFKMSELTHAALVTKNNHSCNVCSKEKPKLVNKRRACNLIQQS